MMFKRCCSYLIKSSIVSHIRHSTSHDTVGIFIQFKFTKSTSLFLNSTNCLIPRNTCSPRKKQRITIFWLHFTPSLMITASRISLTQVQSWFVEPKTYKQAAASPQAEQWLQAIREEVEGLVRKDTWEVVRPIPGVVPIPSRSTLPLEWASLCSNGHRKVEVAYIFKYAKDHTVERFKA
jgi:hypothetical protein